MFSFGGGGGGFFFALVAFDVAVSLLSSSPEFGGVTNCLTTLGWWVWVCIRLCLVMVVVYTGEQMLLSTLALKQRVPLQ